MTEKKKYEKPCCAADAMQRIRKVNVGGITVGLAMLDCIFEEVASLDLSTDEQLQRELLRQVKIYNYVPRQAEDAYGEAILREYRKGV
jgi:hypothetical protein